MADVTINLIVTAKGLENLGKVGKQLQDVGKQADQIGKGFEKVGSQLTGVGTALTSVALPLVALGGAAIKTANDFNRSFLEIQNLVGASAAEVKFLKEETLGLAGTVGKAPQELADALFAIKSAGLNANDSLELLEISAKASAIGLGETKTVSLAVAGAIKAYGAENLSAEKAVDILTNTVKFGNLEAASLAGTLGRVTPVAAQLGVEFADLGAFLAINTRVTGSAEAAVTGLRGALNAILGPTPQAIEQAKLLGISFEEVRATIQDDGLAAALDILVTATDGDDAALKKLIPDVEALTAVLAVAGSQGEDFAEVQGDIREGLGVTEEGFENFSKSAVFSFDQFSAKSKAAFIELGDALAPALADILDAAEPVFDFVKNLAQGFKDLDPETKKTIVGFALAAAAAGPLLIILGQLTSGVGKFIQLGGSLAGGLGKLSGALSGTAGAATLGKGAILGLSTAAVAATAVISVKGTQAIVGYGDALRGIDDPIRDAVAQQGFLAQTMAVLPDIISVAKGAFFGFIDVIKGIPILGKAIEIQFQFLKVVFDEFAKGLSFISDAATSFFEKFVGAEEKAESAQSAFVISQNSLARASEIAGMTITDQAEADEILSAEIGRLRLENEQNTKATLESAGATDDAAAAAAADAAAKAENAAAAAAAALAQEAFAESVKSAASSLETAASVGQEFNVLIAAIGQVGGIAALTGPQLQTLRTTLVEMGAAGVDVSAQLAAVDERLSTLGLDEVTLMARELSMELGLIPAADAAQQLDVFRASLAGVADVSSLSVAQGEALFQKLQELKTAAGALPPDLAAIEAQLRDLGFDEAGAEVRAFVKELEAGGLAGAEKRIDLLSKGVAEFGGVANLTAKQLADLDAEAKDLEASGGKLTGTLKDVQAAAAEGRVAELAKEFGELNGVMSKDTVAALDEVEAAIVSTLEGGADSTDMFKEAASAALDELAAKSPEAAERVAEIKDKFDLATSGTIDFASALQVTANIMQAFGVSADSSLGTIIAGVSQLGPAIEQVSGDLKAGKLVGGTIAAGDVAGTAQGIAGGIAGVASATSRGGAGKAALGGAIAGAQAGAQVGGPIGAGVGAAAGAIIGFFRGRARDKIRKEIKDTVGADVSEDLAVAIKDAAKEAGRTIQQESLLSLGDIISDAGIEGFEGGLVGVQNAVLDVFAGIESGALPAKEAIESAGAAFTAMAEEVFVAGQVADAELINIVKASRELGQEIPEIAAFTADQLALAASGISKLVGGIQIFDLQDAQDQATIFAGAFFATMEEVGLLEAVDAFQPAFEELKSQIEQFGGDVNLGGLGRIFEIAGQEEFRPLLEGVQGLDEALTGLSNTGFLTADSFQAFQNQAAGAFEQLTAAGLSPQEALQQMGPLLNNLVQASNEFGFALDGNTQGLVDQAMAAGVAFRVEPMQQVADTLVVIAGLLGATSEQMAALGTTSATTAGQVGGLGTAMGGVGAAAQQTGATVQSSFAGGFSGAVQSAQQIEGPIGDVLSGVGDQLAKLDARVAEGGGFFGGNAGKRLAEKQAEGIREALPDVEAAAAQLAMGIRAPLEMLAEEGEGARDNLAKQILEEFDNAEAAAAVAGGNFAQSIEEFTTRAGGFLGAFGKEEGLDLAGNLSERLFIDSEAVAQNISEVQAIFEQSGGEAAAAAIAAFTPEEQIDLINTIFGDDPTADPEKLAALIGDPRAVAEAINATLAEGATAISTDFLAEPIQRGILDPLAEAGAVIGETIGGPLSETVGPAVDAIAAKTGEITAGFENIGGKISELPETAGTAVEGISTAFAEGSAQITEGLTPVADKLAVEITEAGNVTSAAVTASFTKTSDAIKVGLGQVAETFAGPVSSSAEKAAAAALKIADAAKAAAKAAAEIDFGGGGGGPDFEAQGGFRGKLTRDTVIQAHAGEFVNIVPADETRRMNFVSAQGGMGPGAVSVSTGGNRMEFNINGGGDQIDETFFRNRILPMFEESLRRNENEIVQRIREQIFEEVR